MRAWVYNPHTGGKSVPLGVKVRTEQRILDYAAKHYPGKYIRIDVRFRGALCYVDVYTEPDVPSGYGHHLARHAISGKRGCGIPRRIFVGSGSSETKTVGALPGIPTRTKNTSQVS